MSDDEDIPVADKLARSHATKPKPTTKRGKSGPKPKTARSSLETNRTANSNVPAENALESSVAEVSSRLIDGCICHGTCYTELQAEAVYRHRLNIAELTKQEHDMYLMGVTMACLAARNVTHRHKERVRQRATYVFQGKRVCLDAFLYLENVTQYHLKRIRRHVMVHGVVPRVHGNVRKKPHNALPLDFYQYAENFVKTELLHNKPDGNRNYVVVNVLRMNFYQFFRQRCVDENRPTMSYSTFRHFMKKQFPKVRFKSTDDKVKANKRQRAPQIGDDVPTKLDRKTECVIVEQPTIANESTDDSEQVCFEENVIDTNEQDVEYCIEYIENDDSNGIVYDPDRNGANNCEYQTTDYLEYSDNED